MTDSICVGLLQMTVDPSDDPHHQVDDYGGNKKDNHSSGIMPYPAVAAQLIEFDLRNKST